MAAPKPVYDLMLLLDADAPSERRTEILREVEGFVERSGTIESKHEWGVRPLAYEIQHHKDAEYHLLQFGAPAEAIERLRAMLRITDGVLRHRVIRVLPGTPPPPVMRAEPRAAAAAPEVAAVGASVPAPAEGAAEAAPAPAQSAPAAPEEEPAPAAAAEEPAAEEEPAAAEEPAPAEPPVEAASSEDASAETPPAA